MREAPGEELVRRISRLRRFQPLLYVAPLALNFLPEHVVADIVADLGTLCAAITNIFLDSDEGASFLVAVENCVEIKIFKIRST